MTAFVALALTLALDPERAVQATPTSAEIPRSGVVESTDTAPPTPTPRPEDKTLVASLDIEQGAGKDRLSLYRDGTLVLVKTYEGVRKVKKKVLSEEEIGIIRKVCREALSLDVSEYHVDVLGDAKPRRFRVEVGRKATFRGSSSSTSWPASRSSWAGRGDLSRVCSIDSTKRRSPRTTSGIRPDCAGETS
ncbi:MAG: hypothetical protein IPF66_05445 [Holophagales bacterium]|nr:hypothetical protein [Holophagales bacterium]